MLEIKEGAISNLSLIFRYYLLTWLIQPAWHCANLDSITSGTDVAGSTFALGGDASLLHDLIPLFEH